MKRRIDFETEFRPDTDIGWYGDSDFVSGLMLKPETFDLGSDIQWEIDAINNDLDNRFNVIEEP